MKKITLLLSLFVLGISLHAQPTIFLFDFGKDDVANGNATTNPDVNGNHWNNILGTTTGSPLVNLVDVNNQSTTATLGIDIDFVANGIQNGGLLAPSDTLLDEFAIPTATEDYFFTTGSAAFTLAGLNHGGGYIFSFFGTRNTTTTRVSRYTLDGAGSYNGTLQTSGVDLGGPGYNGNNSTILVSDTVFADGNGEISLTLEVVQGGFAYLGVMKMVELAPTGANQAPFADAGTDAFLPSGTTSDSLRGSGLDPDNDALIYLWTQVGGPTVTIDQNTLAQTAISGLSDGNQYTFELTVDDGTVTDKDTVNITVGDGGFRTFYIDLGPNDGTNGNITASPDANGNHWNNLTNPSAGPDALALVDNTGMLTAINLSIVSGFGANGIQNGGLLNPDPNLLEDLAIATATQDYFFTTSSGTLSFDDLDPGKGYVFSLFNSRNSASARITQYTFSGATLHVDTLQSSGSDIGGGGYNGNNSTLAVTPVLRPNANGRITIGVAEITGGFAYLNAFKVEEVEINPQYLVDFGPNDVTNGNLTSSPDTEGNYWNNLTDPLTTADTVFFVQKNNAPSDIYAKVNIDFGANGIQNGGLLNPDPSLLGELGVGTATEDYFFTTGTATIEFGGLDTASGYIFSYFGTRNSASTRVTSFTAMGSNAVIDSLQTSGTDLGGVGYNGNNRTVQVSDTIYPDVGGKILLDVGVVSGGFAYLGCMKITEILPLPEQVALCPTQDSLLIAYMGSSVADGFGATNSQGYAYQNAQLLNSRFNAGDGLEWRDANISVGGNNTILLGNRWDTDLLPLCPGYVVYGLSLGNEGISSQGQAAFDQFRDNMLVLIDRARDAGIEPVVVNCYARADFTSSEYDFTKQMNLLIHGWDVASVNSLGAVDDGAGRWADGYEADPFHPNTAGHREMSYSFVPSLFDALAEGKPQPQRVTGTYLTIDKNDTDYQLEFTPDDVLHSFTCSFDIRTTETGVMGGFTTDGGGYGALFIDRTEGTIQYLRDDNAGIVGTSTINNGFWKTVTLTHYFARGKTLLYVNDVFQGDVDEQLNPDKFFLSEAKGPTADYRDWFIYRAGMTTNELSEITAGGMLKSSLELYAALDGQGATAEDTLYNYAQATNSVARVAESEVVTSIEGLGDDLLTPLQVFPNPVQDQANVSFSLRQAGAVQLHVYDLVGRKVDTIVETNLGVGLHQYEIDTTHLAGGQVYLIRLEIEGNSYATQMIRP
ncbi:MAG: GDSL-type esterase/lipase family protein [Bacteroidota bacterium]